MAATPPTVEELGPLLGDSAMLDQPADDMAVDPGDAEFDAAAVSAVGTRAKASALKDAIESVLRKHGLLSASDAVEEESESPAIEEEEDFEY